MLEAKVAFAKRTADGKAQRTLVDLEKQQQEKLDGLIINLMKQQREMLENVNQHLDSTPSASANVLQQSGLQELLIQERLLSPSAAVMKRKQIHHEYLNNSDKERVISDEEIHDALIIEDEVRHGE